jgi:hypothetical protein
MMCKYANLRDLRICGFDTESVSVTQANMYQCLIYVTNTNHTSHLTPSYSRGVQSFHLGDNDRPGKGGGMRRLLCGSGRNHRRNNEGSVCEEGGR